MLLFEKFEKFEKFEGFESLVVKVEFQHCKPVIEF